MHNNKYQPHIYLIKTLTNLHVGGGESNYDIIDNQVQRDPSNNLPTIYSSSIKGALRDYFAEGDFAGADVIKIFGSEPGESKHIQQGLFRFLNADLLALPSPNTDSDSLELYKMVYSSSNLDDFIRKIKLLDKDSTLSKSSLVEKMNAVHNTQAFNEIQSELPVLARNQLENGVSQNLWYEEVVPRFSYFAFTVLAQDGQLIEAFNNAVNNNVVQIGANATIGYGLCYFEKLN